MIRPAESALPGFEDIKPMVFRGPLHGGSLTSTRFLRDALEKLGLNDYVFLL